MLAAGTQGPWLVAGSTSSRCLSGSMNNRVSAIIVATITIYLQLIQAVPVTAALAWRFRERESVFLRRRFVLTRRTIDIRCRLINDERLLHGVRKAALSGVTVRIVVDRPTAKLLRLVKRRIPRLLVRMADSRDFGHFQWSVGRYSYAIFDDRIAWFGAVDWDPTHWTGYNIVASDSDPMKRPWRIAFDRLWDKSVLQVPLHDSWLRARQPIRGYVRFP